DVLKPDRGLSWPETKLDDLGQKHVSQVGGNIRCNHPN
ncbi:MAG: hypothetical protein QOJ84_2174, partial [Bradyrhizobium sp.]|nr:hypothetical protein [Bradyrhizobium sp.]